MPTNTMERTWLIQRLEKSHTGPMGAIANAFSFGGGLVNGGLTREAADVLRTIFSFDYMGAAEFEWGAVPKALSGLAGDQKQLVSATMTIGKTPVYIICRAEHMTEVEKRIREDAAGKLRLKEWTNLSRVLKSEPDTERWPTRTCGWLELDNGFFFFTDRVMWENTRALFGVTTHMHRSA